MKLSIAPHYGCWSQARALPQQVARRQLGQRHICSHPKVEDKQLDQSEQPSISGKAQPVNTLLQTPGRLSQQAAAIVQRSARVCASAGLVAGISTAAVLGLSVVLGMPTCCVIRLLQERALQLGNTGLLGTGMLSASIGYLAANLPMVATLAPDAEQALPARPADRVEPQPGQQMAPAAVPGEDEAMEQGPLDGA